MFLAVAAGLMTGVASGAASSTHPDRLLPRRALAARHAANDLRTEIDRRRALPRFLLDTSRNPELRARGLLTSAPRRARKLALQQASADTVHVLLARVGFATNRQPGLTTVPPSGDFLLDPDPAVIVDPPPHDAAYFEAHLLAMTSYYDVMSRGRLVIDSTVFPPAGEPSIRFGDPADYGPGADGFWTIEALERYFRDAVAKIDSAAAGRLDLGPYAYDPTGQRLGTIIVAHSGGDLQGDVRQDSPNDLPTFHILLSDSIPVQGGAYEVRMGVIVPETATQDGLLAGIQGEMCHEFGHQLGLPDWYNTRTLMPAVGEWSLMDSGSGAIFAFALETDPDTPIFARGLLPTGLCAADRYFLGWDQPVVLHAPRDSVQLRPPNGDGYYGDFPTAALLPVSPDEYFLIENRRDLLAFRVDNDVESCPYLSRDTDTGVILWMSKDDPNKSGRQRHNSGEYDFWISAPTAPESAHGACGALGFGLLVWHVDERPLIEGYASNTVNTNSAYRALRLVEASGDFEIGDIRLPTVSFFGDGWNDPFRAGFKTVLRAETVPNNWNNDWAQSGWEITDVTSVAPESHLLHVRVLDGVAGWPQTLRVAPDSLLQVEPRGALALDVAGLGPALVVADSLAVHALVGPALYELHVGAVLPGTLAAAGPSFAGDALGTLGALDGQRVWLWEARWDGAGAPVRAGFPLDVPGGTGTRLLLDEEFGFGLVETAAGEWLPFDRQGLVGPLLDLQPGARETGVVLGRLVRSGPEVDLPQIALAGGDRVGIWSFPVPGSTPPSSPQYEWRLDFTLNGLDGGFIAAGQVDARRPDAQVVVLHRDGRLRVVDATQGRMSGFSDLPRDAYTGMALADVDGDGSADIVATSPARIAGENSRGAWLFNTPRVVRDLFALRTEPRITSPPIVADVTGDELPEILFGTDLGLLYALDADGQPVPGYPRKTLPDGPVAALLAENLDGTQESREVIAVSPISAAVFDLPGGDVLRPGWTQAGGGPGRTGFVPPGSAVPGPVAPRLVALERPFFAYPNPARESTVRLRVAVRSDGPYEIRIYNLEGEQVFETRGMARAGAPQEVEWRVAELASGVYLCRFVSAAAGVSTPLVEPITVVR